MYAIRMDVDPRLRTNSALRAYARMEYGSEDAAWLLASINSTRRKVPRRTLLSRLSTRRVRPSHRPVACKGSSPHHRSEAAALG